MKMQIILNIESQSKEVFAKLSELSELLEQERVEQGTRESEKVEVEQVEVQAKTRAKKAVKKTNTQEVGQAQRSEAKESEQKQAEVQSEVTEATPQVEEQEKKEITDAELTQAITQALNNGVAGPIIKRMMREEFGISRSMECQQERRAEFLKRMQEL